MNFEHTTEYGPYAPDKDQVFKVFSEFGEDSDESKIAMGLWVDERQRLADLSGERINKLLVDFEIGVLHVEAGLIVLAINCYDAISDVLEYDHFLTDHEFDLLRQKRDELERLIDEKS